MKVYIVWNWNPLIPVDEGAPYIVKVFDSKEKADNYIKNQKQDKECEYSCEVWEVE